MKGVTAMKELPAEKKNQRLTAAESNGHIVAYKACVILADRHRGIEQGRQRISPDIAHQGRIPVKAVHDILDMPAVQLQKAALYDLRTHIPLVDAYAFPAAATGLRHQFYKTVQTFLVVWMVMQEIIVINVLFYQLPVSIHLIYPIHPITSGRKVIHRKIPGLFRID